MMAYTLHILALVCVLEAGTSRPDCTAIVHVLHDRASMAGVSIVTMARRYSAPLKRGHRARVPASVLNYVRAAYAGENACPGALHWGARSGIDRVRARRAIRRGEWVALNCDTLNAFYALRPHT